MISLFLTLAVLGQTPGSGLRPVSVSGAITGNGTSGSPLACRNASLTDTGCVSIGAQSFAGAKTFGSQVALIAGTGPTNAVVFGATGTGLYSGGFFANDLTVFTGGGSRWGWGNSNFIAGSNNSYDVGSTTLRFQRIWLGTLGLNIDFTDSSGTPGAATINKSSGTSAFAAGAGSVVITSSTATTAARFQVQPLRADATCTLTPWVVTKASGSFTVATQGGAVCTAITAFDWQIVQ